MLIKDFEVVKKINSRISVVKRNSALFVLKKGPSFFEEKLHPTLQHTNLVRCYDVIRAERSHYLVLEYIPGENASQIHSLSRKKWLRCGNDLLNGLEYLYTKKIAHNDIWGGNFIISSTGGKIIDLGAAESYESYNFSGIPDLTCAARVIGWLCPYVNDRLKASELFAAHSSSLEEIRNFMNLSNEYFNK